MVASPYAFLRGSANIMADDFAALPATGITPVICGDAHLGNFGFYASPERELVFDLNDFDEAHPGAWEWDLRRLVASVHVAGRQNGFRESACADAVRHCVAEYREQLAHLAEQPLLARSFDRLDVDRLRPRPPGPASGDEIERAAARARRRTSDRALPRFTEQHDGGARLVEEPPLITRPSDPEQYERIAAALDGYLQTRCRRTGRGSWAATGSSTSRTRWSGSARSGCGRTSRCARAAARTTCSSCSSSRPGGRWSRRTARRRGLAPAPGPAGGRVPAGAADGQRPAARLDHGRRAPVLRAAVPRHEGRDRRRGHRRRCAGRLRRHLRVSCSPRATPGPAARR